MQRRRDEFDADVVFAEVVFVHGILFPRYLNVLLLAEGVIMLLQRLSQSLRRWAMNHIRIIMPSLSNGAAAARAISSPRLGNIGMVIIAD